MNTNKDSDQVFLGMAKAYFWIYTMPFWLCAMLSLAIIIVCSLLFLIGVVYG